MRAIHKTIAALRHQHRGLLPVPALIIIIYCFLFNLIHYQKWCMTMGDNYEFWSFSYCMGFSLLDITYAINILFAIYLILDLWSFIMEKGYGVRRTLAYWASYLMAFVLLVMLQVGVCKTAEHFSMPGEVVEFRLKEFPRLDPRYQLVDVFLPQCEMCEGFKQPFEERFNMIVTRPGHYVRDRVDLGKVEDCIPYIRSQMTKGIEGFGKAQDGSSELILLIRADSEARFESIHKVIQVGKDQGFYRIELACRPDLVWKFQDHEGDWKRFYEFPMGKLDAYLPKANSSARAGDEYLDLNKLDAYTAEDYLAKSVKIDVIYDEQTRREFFVKIQDKKYPGDELSHKFYRAMKDLQVRIPGLKARIVAHENVEHGQMIQVFSRILKAGLTDISFGYESNLE
jgi:biopolymer transport protein ExbD